MVGGGVLLGRVHGYRTHERARFIHKIVNLDAIYFQHTSTLGRRVTCAGLYSTGRYSTPSTDGAAFASFTDVSPSSPTVNGVVRFVGTLPTLQRSLLPSSERP